MLSSPKFLSLLLWALALLTLGKSAQAQEQDRKMMDRLTRPNLSLEYDTRQSTFGTRSAATNKVVSTKEFGGNRGFVSKEFYAKEFLGQKRSWFGNLFFSTKSASTSGKYEIPNAGQKYGTKVVPTKEAYGSDRVMSTTAFAATDLQYLKRNRFDTSIKAAPPQGGSRPLGYTGDLRPMSIDDVRELLNKNK